MTQIYKWAGTLIVIVLLSSLSSCSTLSKTSSSAVASVNRKEEMAFRTAYANAVDSSLQALSQENGFFNSDSFYVGIPQEYDKVESALRGIGLGQYPDEVIQSMNRVSEQSTARVYASIVDVINNWSDEEMAHIMLSKDQNPASTYLESQVSQRVKKEITPIIAELMDTDGATGSWDAMFEKYNQIPFILSKDNSDFNLTNYVTSLTSTALFKTIERCEIKHSLVK